MRNPQIFFAKNGRNPQIFHPRYGLIPVSAATDLQIENVLLACHQPPQRNLISAQLGCCAKMPWTPAGFRSPNQWPANESPAVLGGMASTLVYSLMAFLLWIGDVSLLRVLDHLGIEIMQFPVFDHLFQELDPDIVFFALQQCRQFRKN